MSQRSRNSQSRTFCHLEATKRSWLQIDIPFSGILVFISSSLSQGLLLSKSSTNFLFRHTCATVWLILKEGIFLWWFSAPYNLFECWLAFQYFLSYFQRIRSDWMYLHQNFIYNVSIKSLINELFWVEGL